MSKKIEVFVENEEIPVQPVVVHGNPGHPRTSKDSFRTEMVFTESRAQEDSIEIYKDCEGVQCKSCLKSVHVKEQTTSETQRCKVSNLENRTC